MSETNLVKTGEFIEWTIFFNPCSDDSWQNLTVVQTIMSCMLPIRLVRWTFFAIVNAKLMEQF